PDPSGFGATAHATFTLGRAAAVTARVFDASGRVVQTLLEAEQLPAGENSVDWNAAAAPDGRYRLVVSVGRAKASVDLVVDRSLTNLIASAPAVSPNGDGVQDGATFSFSLAAAVPVRLEVQRDGAVVATLLPAAARGPGPQVADWNGKDANGAPLPDGSYTVVATVTDALGDVPVSIPLAVDSTPPTLTLLD